MKSIQIKQMKKAWHMEHEYTQCVEIEYQNFTMLKN